MKAASCGFKQEALSFSAFIVTGAQTKRYV